MPCCILYFWDLLGGVTRKGDVIEVKPSKMVLNHSVMLSTIWMVVVQLKRPNRELVQVVKMDNLGEQSDFEKPVTDDLDLSL